MRMIPLSMSRVPAVRVQLALEARECRLLGSDKKGGDEGDGGTMGSKAAESVTGETKSHDFGNGGQSVSAGGVTGEFSGLFEGWVSPRDMTASLVSFPEFLSISQF